MTDFEVTATLTEIRSDHMQKWERTDLDVNDQARYIWLAPFQSKPNLAVGQEARLSFNKGVNGAWAGWKVGAIRIA
jgi:hypothetical protein